MTKSLTFLIISTTDWDAPQFGSRQQIALQWVRRGHQVLFVDIPRALHSFISDPAGMRRAMTRLGKVRQIPDGPLVYTPWPVLPVYYNPVMNAINQRLMVQYVRAALAKLNWQVDVLWTYWPNTAHLIGQFNEQMAVYHCIDDFAAVGYFMTPKQTIREMEHRQCRKADVIFARTKGLTADKQQSNPNTHFLPGGVDVDVFNPANLAAPRTDLVNVPTPRVGFLGTIDDRVDVPLLTYCAQQIPEATFVMIGPVKSHRVDVQPLEALPNVHFLPACTFAEAPAMMASFDVCLIPYVVNTYTKGLSPIKLHEYLALGKSIVTTRLPYLEREVDHITIADDYDAFADAIHHHLTHPPTEAEQKRRRAIAEATAWGHQVDQIEQYLSALLR